MGPILVGLWKIAILIDRSAIYEKFYLGVGVQSEKNLEKALVLLYAATLVYLAKAKRFYTRNTAGTIHNTV